MLKLGQKEKQILDMLIIAEPKVVALRLNIPIERVYAADHYFRRKVQNAEDFLAVARGRYKILLSRRLKTPSIMPLEGDEKDE